MTTTPGRRPAPGARRTPAALALGLVLASAGTGAPAAELWDRIRAGVGRTYAQGSGWVEDRAAAGGAALKKGRAAADAAAAKGLAKGQALVTDTRDHFDRPGTPAEIRARIDAMAAATLTRLFARDPRARRLFGQSYGYAVFDVRQVALTVTAGYGYGLAVGGGERVYMKTATAGVEIGKGLGGFASHWVALFADRAAFRGCVGTGLDASAEASALAGDRRAAAEARWLHGVTFYRVIDGGLKVAAGLGGTRFWPDEALNAPAPGGPRDRVP